MQTAWRTATRAQAEEWALVLASAGVESRVEADAGGWQLVVAPADAERAASTLAAYAHEQPGSLRWSTAKTDRSLTLAGLAAAALLLAIDSLRNYGLTPPSFLDRGSADAARVLAGEWWRVVTALTLHANVAHVANNAVALAVFGSGVCLALGDGVGLWLILLAGAGGNALNAILRGAPHDAIGASTAVFGAVGVSSAIQLLRRLRPAGKTAPPPFPATGLGRARAWAPIAAGAALLAMLGSAQHTDVLAHAFGFVVGLGLGTLVAGFGPPRLSAATQAVLALAALPFVGACWWLALR